MSNSGKRDVRVCLTNNLSSNTILRQLCQWLVQGNIEDKETAKLALHYLIDLIDNGSIGPSHHVEDSLLYYISTVMNESMNFYAGELGDENEILSAEEYEIEIRLCMKAAVSNIISQL